MAKNPLNHQKDVGNPHDSTREYYFLGEDVAGDISVGADDVIGAEQNHANDLNRIVDHVKGDIEDMRDEIKEDEQLVEELVGNKFPAHHCDPENPCPALVGAECEGSDPSKWPKPSWLKGSAIDDGMIGNREQPHGSRGVDTMRVQPRGGLPDQPNDKEWNRRDPAFTHGPQGTVPTALDGPKENGSGEINYQGKTVKGPGFHEKQISVEPETTQQTNIRDRRDRFVEAFKKESDKKADEILPLLLEKPEEFPGTKNKRKVVPTGEGGAIGIPGIDGSAPHAVEDTPPSEPEQFRGGQPASNTVTDEFIMPKPKGQATRPIGNLQHASVEIFAPVNQEDLFEGEGF